MAINETNDLNNAMRQALSGAGLAPKANETETGMTVHWVSPVCDGGEIIAQFRTPITPDDTPDDIAAKEHVLEMKHFPQVIEAILKQEKLIQ